MNKEGYIKMKLAGQVQIKTATVFNGNAFKI